MRGNRDFPSVGPGGGIPPHLNPLPPEGGEEDFEGVRESAFFLTNSQAKGMKD